MKALSSNVLLTCLISASLGFFKPPVIQGQPRTPATPFRPAQAAETQAEEAKLREAMKRAPENPSYPARLGELLANENRLDEAVVFFEKALALDPSDAVTRRNLAASYWQLGKLPEARKNLETVLEAHPDDTWSVLLLGMVSEDLGDHKTAAKLLGGILPLVAQRPETIFSLARAYYHLGETEKARGALQMLAEHAPGPDATFQGGRVAAEGGDYETAEKMFLSIRGTYSDPGALNYNLALAQYSAEHYADCEKTLQDSIAQGHGTSDVYALLARAYQKQDRLQEMLTAFETAINMDPSNETTYLDLGQALVEKRTYGTAMEVAKETVKRFPSSSRAWSLKGSVELGMDTVTEALKSYAKARELDPNDPKAALGYALTLWNANQYEEAGKSFAEGARKFPRDAFFLLKYAIFLLNSPQELDTEESARIKALLKRSEELDDSIAETHFQLGNLALKEEQYDVALKELGIAAREDPELSKVHYALARVYRRMGRDEDAVREAEIHKKLKEKEDRHIDVNAAMATRHP
jgi:tetratricopeptide (TPR) repeat protein